MPNQLKGKVIQEQFQLFINNKQVIKEKLTDVIRGILQNSKGKYFFIENNIVTLQKTFFDFISEYNERSLHYLDIEIYKKDIHLTIEVQEWDYRKIQIKINLFIDNELFSNNRNVQIKINLFTDNELCSNRSENCTELLVVNLDLDLFLEKQKNSQLEETLYNFVIRAIDSALIESKNDVILMTNSYSNSHFEKILQNKVNEKLITRNRQHLPIVCKLNFIDFYSNSSNELYDIDLQLNAKQQYLVNYSLLEKYNYTVDTHYLKNEKHDFELININIKDIQLNHFLELSTKVFIERENFNNFTNELQKYLKSTNVEISSIRCNEILSKNEHFTNETKSVLLSFVNGYSCTIDVNSPNVFSYSITKKSSYELKLFEDNYEICKIDSSKDKNLINQTIIKEIKSVIENTIYLINLLG